MNTSDRLSPLSNKQCNALQRADDYTYHDLSKISHAQNGRMNYNNCEKITVDLP